MSTALVTVLAPFSSVNSATRLPLTTTLISELRGCICGVLKPHGPKKPRVMETPVPIRGGKDWRSARTVWPPLPVVRVSEGGLLKSKTKSRSLGIRVMRSTALGAKISFWIRARLSAWPLTVVFVTGVAVFVDAGGIVEVGAARVRAERREERRRLVVCILLLLMGRGYEDLWRERLETKVQK